MEHNCTTCQHFRHSETKSDGWRDVEGLKGVLEPKMVTIPMHCVKHNGIFKMWWERNKDKPSSETTTLKCFELHECYKPLEEMHRLAEEILKKV